MVEAQCKVLMALPVGQFEVGDLASMHYKLEHWARLLSYLCFGFAWSRRGKDAHGSLTSISSKRNRRIKRKEGK